jgi:hypothetical protein
MRCVLAAEHDLRLASNRRKAEREIAMRILIAGRAVRSAGRWFVA